MSRATTYLRYLSCYVLCLLAAFPLGAQTPDTAAIRGHVTDQTHAAVAAVEIAVNNVSTGMERKALSDSAGDFWLAGLQAGGRYEITATRAGFAARHVENVVLE